MMKGDTELYEDKIKTKIYTFRGLHVMLDSDLAELYGVSTKRLNEQVGRNIERFPISFMFQLKGEEYDFLKSQIATSSYRWGGKRKLPYAFTEQGVAMLSGVIRSKKAIKVHIQIINAFVSMRKFILSNAQIFQRLDNVDVKLLEHDNKLKQVFDAIESKQITPKQGIFFEGQIFDAYKFVSELVKSARNSIILIDNYIDDSVLTLFSERDKNINVVIYTSNLTSKLRLDLKKYNSQYPKIDIKEFKHSHDRFMIIDNKEVYHIGASLKDLGKKWFAFSKFDKKVFTLLERLE